MNFNKHWDIVGKHAFLGASKYHWINYDITKLVKVSSKEKQDIVKFSLIWSPDKDPDIAFVFNIYNYIQENNIEVVMIKVKTRRNAHFDMIYPPKKHLTILLYSYRTKKSITDEK